MSEIPKVKVLSAIVPSPESAREEQFTYDKLGKLASESSLFDGLRRAAFFDTEAGSLAEERTGRQLGLQYMLMTADQLNRAGTPEAKRRWSERYTRSSVELYGKPKADVARQLGNAMVSQLLNQARDNYMQGHAAEYFKELAMTYGLNGESHEGESMQFEFAAKEIGTIFETRFASAYNALELGEQTEKIGPAKLAEKFDRALSILASDNDAAWGEWGVERNPDLDMLKVDGEKNKIVVGMNRADVAPIDAKGLFTHEVLVHAMRAINGRKVSVELGSGLPDYLDAEEGLGVFAEYAVTGTIPSKNIDRYVDIALALGQIDGIPKTRQELVRFSMARARLRNEIAADDDKHTEEDIIKMVYANVNRIYRGSLGNEYIGVYTKDIAYQKGFMQMGQFITDQLEQGYTGNEVFDYLLQGKFDPANKKHIELVKEL